MCGSRRGSRSPRNLDLPAYWAPRGLSTRDCSTHRGLPSRSHRMSGVTPPPHPPESWPTFEAEYWAIVIVFVALLSVFALVVVPIPSPFSGTLSTNYCPSCSGGESQYPSSVVLGVPSNSPVILTWHVSGSADPVELSVYTGANQCIQSGTSGVCSLHSWRGQSILVEVADLNLTEGPILVSYSGSVTAPLL